MTRDWKGRRAIITGAGSGIGRATAVRLAEEKMDLVLLGGKRAGKLEETADLVRKAGGTCRCLAGDLCDFGWLFEQAGDLASRGADVLINNAGVAWNSPFEEVTEERFDAIMRINVRVPYFLTQKLLPALRKSSHATVINISSVVGHAGYPEQSAYVASKHALLGFTKSLAAEVYRDGIRVHAICPGGVCTDMVKVARPDLSDAGMIQPEDIAEIVWFFLLNRGNAVVDEILVHRVNKQPFLV